MFVINVLGIYENEQLLNLSSEKLLGFISPIFPSTKHPDALVSTIIAKRKNLEIRIMLKKFFAMVSSDHNMFVYVRK